MGAASEGASLPLAPVRQYDIFRANLPKPIGRRPVLLLTRSAGYAYLNKVIVVEITSKIRGIPQEVPLGEPEGLPRDSVVNLDNIHVIPKNLLGEPIGALASGREQEIKRALGYAIDWPELKML